MTQTTVGLHALLFTQSGLTQEHSVLLRPYTLLLYPFALKRPYTLLLSCDPREPFVINSRAILGVQGNTILLEGIPRSANSQSWSTLFSRPGSRDSDSK